MSTEDSPAMNKALAWSAVLGIAAAAVAFIGVPVYVANGYLGAPYGGSEEQYRQPHTLPAEEMDRKRLKHEAYIREIESTTVATP
jgi:hypothetical protein